MKDEEFQELLADYLAGELDEREASRFQAELEASPERRKLAHELQAAAAALEAHIPSQEEAQRRVGSLAFDDLQIRAREAARRARPIRLRYQRSKAVLRYAAVIVLAFGAGFVVRGWPSAHRESPAPPVATALPINAGYLDEYRRVTQAFPEASSFSRSLLMLARR